MFDKKHPCFFLSHIWKIPIFAPELLIKCRNLQIKKDNNYQFFY